MPTSYNLIAGTSLERLAALSDGIFAVSMTLLVLDIKTPGRESIHSKQYLLHALLPVAPRFLRLGLTFRFCRAEKHTSENACATFLL